MESEESRDYLLCFDFTTKRFGEPLKLPFNSEGDGEDNVALTCVRDEKLAVLYRSYKSIDIWISTKIQPNVVLWSKFVGMDLVMLTDGFRAGCFFIDEEKQVAVVFDRRLNYSKACIIGKDGYFKDSVNVGVALPRYFTSYVPSLVSLKHNKPSKRKQRDN
ncbi:PREDICTED: F-box protein At1g11810-like [Camelina sativa]|uniref:F-box protein At1g11810-like n=1 Tax=Camelina sativa TaxID=90675 RepID=A0ABM0XRG2_CAMSA|nr:PREDICTED: F-box protein At1g11810-like [Camelina sativa]